MSDREYSNFTFDETRFAVDAINRYDLTQTFEYFASVVPQEVFDKTKRVLLTGCGDSYCAALAARPVFEIPDRDGREGPVPVLHTEALRSVDLGRYYNTYRGWDPADAQSTMVCAVSVSGNPYRPVECLSRINALGGTSIAFTNRPEGSPLSEVAQYIIDLHFPKELHLDNVPNVANYEASMFTLMMFGLYTNVCTGRMSMQEALEKRASAVAYVNSFTKEVFDSVEEKVKTVCELWEDAGVDFYDYVAEDQEYATAFFGSAKVVEGVGSLITHDDAEDWCHINYYNRAPEKVGTIAIVNTDSPSFSRDLETVRVMTAIGRPVLVVTDAPEICFPEQAHVVSLPKAKYRWASPLMQHLPLDYVSACLQVLKGIVPFRRGSEIHMRDHGNRFRSEVKIV